MFIPTRKHKEKVNGKNTIKVGKTVPNGAVNLAYFYNKRAKDGSENVIVSEAPKVTIDHLSVTEYEKRYCCPTKDSKYFPNVFFYSDANGYEGDLPLESIKWYDHPHNFEKEVTEVKEYTVDVMDIPEKIIEHTEKLDNGVFVKGNLGVVKIEYTPLEYKDVTESITDKKYARKTVRSGALSSPSHTFDDKISHTDGSYSGELSKVANSERYIPSFADCTVLFKKGDQLGTSATMDVDGYTLPLLETLDSLDKRKAYGFTRYWGRSQTGYYGNSGDDGNFSDATPRLQNELWKPNRIGIWKASPASGSPNSELGTVGAKWWDLSSNGITRHWTYDVDTANAVVGNALHNSGCAWITSSDTLQKTINIAGTPVQAAEALGITHSGTALSAKNYSSTIDSFTTLYNHIWYRSGGGSDVTSSVAVEVMNSGATIDSGNDHFRDVICFYKGVVASKRSYYGKNIITASDITYVAEADYEGELTKESTTTKKEPIKWKAVATFTGTLRGGYIDYNGVAKYVGVATKRDAVGNINPVGDNVRIMFPDNNGLLYEDMYNPKSCILESEEFYITDTFKDGIPLFYSYRLNNPIYDSVGPNEFGLYTGDSIKLLNSRNKELPSRFKYAIKLTRAENVNTYYADIYTSFTTNSGNPTKCVYTSYDPKSNTPIKANTVEQVFVQPSMQRTIDYTVNNVHPVERKNKITIINPLVLEDSRNKITFQYEVVVFKDGIEVSKSNPITATAINHRYALDKEKSKFIGRNYIISPEVKSGYKTGVDIIAGDLDLEQEGVYVARLINTPENNKVKNIVNLFVDTNGKSVVSAEILDDTGFADPNNDNKFTKKINTPGRYVITDGKIRCAYAVKCIDSREIKVLHPREDSLLENWYPGIQFGHATQVFGFRGVKKKYVYSLPEYDTQDYCEYGRPYIRVVNEKAEFVNENTIKVKLTPLYVRLNNTKKPLNLSINLVSSSGTKTELKANSWSFEEGIINLNSIISETDNIEVTYDYEESRYLYRGYFDREKFAEIDLNTNIYHRHTDLSNVPYNIEKTSSLINKIIYFFAKPAMVIDDFTDDGESRFEEKEVRSFLTGNSSDNFPLTVEVTDDGYTGIIGQDGEPYVTSGKEGYNEKRKFSKSVSNTTKIFDDNYNIDEDGFVGTIPKSGVPKLISEVPGPTVSSEFVKYAESSNKDSFASSVAVDENSYVGNIPKYGQPEAISGELIPSVSKTVTETVVYEAGEVPPKTISYNKGGYSGTITNIKEDKEILGYNNKVEVLKKIDVEAKAEHQVWYSPNGGVGNWLSHENTHENPVPNLPKYMATTGILESYEKILADGWVHDTSKSLYKTREAYYQPPTYNADVGEVVMKHFCVWIDPLMTKSNTVVDYDSPIYGKTTVTYSGTVSTQASDTRKWRQTYKGTLSKAGPLISTWEQSYSGELSKFMPDTRVWRQDYKGTATKALVSQDQTEIVFAVSNNANISNIKDIESKIEKMHYSLKDSGLATIKLGLCVFNEGYKDVSFSSGKFTTSLSEFKAALTRELKTKNNSPAKPFTAVKHIAETYNFQNVAKNIVLISLAPPTDNNMIYDAANVCKERHINVHSVSDINDYYSKTYVILSNETSGNACNVENSDWENQLTVAIGSVCLLGEIRVINRETLYHKIDDDKPMSKHDLYIGSIFVRHYTSLDAVELIDSRVRGGGILESISESLRHELEPESDYYFDIGYWDGEPYSENAVIIIKLDKRLLSSNGGRFSEQEIQNAINKWIAAGTLPIIEYVDTMVSAKELNDKLEVISTNTNRLNTKPVISVSTETI